MKLFEPIEVIRARCQAPVEDFNDPLGRLVGSRVSIHLTRLCLALRIPANAVSYAMLAAGLAGGVMLAGGGGWAVGGFACLVGYYLLDCVDGELARYRGETNIEMAAFDYLGHVAVKSLTYAGLGVGLLVETGEPYALIFALAALVATLVHKALNDLPAILFVQKLLTQGDHLDGRVILAHLREGLSRRRAEEVQETGGEEDRLEQAGGTRTGACQGAKWGLAPRLRYLALNFDFAMFLFFVAALVDVIVFAGRSVRLFDLLNVNAKTVLAVFYGLVLPLDLIDHLMTFARSSRLHRQLADYIARSAELDQRMTPDEPEEKATS